MPKYDLKFYDGHTAVICEDCGWHSMINVAAGGRGNLRELKASHSGNCYPVTWVGGGWTAPSHFTYVCGDDSIAVS